ncbi:hypothetical protein ADK75_03800 [Streptomyces virginiae]|uniref:Uncharacterized protein n=1 Tax=Streptomyces virginiae TaxID=1961 RepID=A0A0L8N4K6_STRVG|nr:hypothetical protein ADK75_03800 [Streptomyces virginiae]
MICGFLIRHSLNDKVGDCCFTLVKREEAVGGIGRRIETTALKICSAAFEVRKSTEGAVDVVRSAQVGDSLAAVVTAEVQASVRVGLVRPMEGDVVCRCFRGVFLEPLERLVDVPLSPCQPCRKP